MKLQGSDCEGGCYKRSFTFRFGDCDLNKRASIYAIMKLFSETSGEDYEVRGLGHSVLERQNQAFLLSRLAIEFHKWPEHTQTVSLSTWERGAKGPFFHRDYEMRDIQGALMAAGTSCWLLVKISTREILRPAELYGGLPPENPHLAPCTACKRIRPQGEADLLGQRSVYYSDIDGNGHVNNAVYGRIASDFLPQRFISIPPKSLNVNFNMETRLGETMDIYGFEESAGYIIQGQSDSTTHFALGFGF
jgi:medium-chain acyl-[acyl-carrier-protein] hydrolase